MEEQKIELSNCDIYILDIIEVPRTVPPYTFSCPSNPAASKCNASASSYGAYRKERKRTRQPQSMSAKKTQPTSTASLTTQAMILTGQHATKAHCGCLCREASD